MTRGRIAVSGIGVGLIVATAAAVGLVAVSSPTPADEAVAAGAAASIDRPAAKADVASNRDDAIGRRVPNFVLPDSAGNEAGLADFRDKNFVVLVMLSCQCPISNQYLPILNEIQQKYGG